MHHELVQVQSGRTSGTAGNAAGAAAPSSSSGAAASQALPHVAAACVGIALAWLHAAAQALTSQALAASAPQPPPPPRTANRRGASAAPPQPAHEVGAGGGERPTARLQGALRALRLAALRVLSELQACLALAGLPHASACVHRGLAAASATLLLLHNHSSAAAAAAGSGSNPQSPPIPFGDHGHPLDPSAPSGAAAPIIAAPVAALCALLLSAASTGLAPLAETAQPILTALPTDVPCRAALLSHALCPHAAPWPHPCTAAASPNQALMAGCWLAADEQQVVLALHAALDPRLLLQLLTQPLLAHAAAACAARSSHAASAALSPNSGLPRGSTPGGGPHAAAASSPASPPAVAAARQLQGRLLSAVFCDAQLCASLLQDPAWLHLQLLSPQALSMATAAAEGGALGAGEPAAPDWARVPVLMAVVLLAAGAAGAALPVQLGGGGQAAAAAAGAGGRGGGVAAAAAGRLDWQGDHWR